MQFKVLKPFTDAETKEQYEVGQTVEMAVARALKAAENLAKYGGGFIEPIENEVSETIVKIEVETKIANNEVVERSLFKDGQAVDYEDLTIDELKATLDEIGIEYKARNTKAELIALLKGDREKGEE